MSDEKANADLKFWRALHDVLQSARSTLPYTDEPERIHWDHPDDDWKNEAAIETLEEECSVETDDLISHFCAKRVWPKRSKNNARYFAEKRIKWAIGFTRIFTIPLMETGAAAIPRPPQSGWDLLRWLLTDAYHRRFPPQPETPFYISGVYTGPWQKPGGPQEQT